MGTKIMVWGAFSARGTAKLVFLPRGESFDGEFYREKVLKPTFREIKDCALIIVTGFKLIPPTLFQFPFCYLNRVGFFNPILRNRTRKTSQTSTTKLFKRKSGWIFQQDGARPHTANDTKRLLQKLNPKYRIQFHKFERTNQTFWFQNSAYQAPRVARQFT